MLGLMKISQVFAESRPQTPHQLVFRHSKNICQTCGNLWQVELCLKVFLKMLLSVLKSNSTADSVFMIAQLARIDILILRWFAHSQDLKSQVR